MILLNRQEVDDLQHRIAALSPRRRQLLAVRNPLSFAQERLWFLDRLEQGAAYHIPLALKIDGSFDRAVLELCFNEIVRRHEVLRTTFTAPDGEPLQIVHPVMHLALPIIDLTRCGNSCAEEMILRRCLAVEIRRGFDLERGPLLRSMVFRLSSGEQILLVVLHHIVTDGWSQELLARELSELYKYFFMGLPSPFSDLELQYVDFARWQRRSFKGEALAPHLEFWRRHLEGAPPVHELPIDRPRPAARLGRGARRSFELSRSLTLSVRQLARQSGATLFATFLTVAGSLLGRLGGHDDLVLGSPTANRSRPELEPLIGCFLNMLPLRIRLNRELSVREMLEEAQKIVLDSLEHQALPFERLVEELKPERSLLHAPIFQIVFIFLIHARQALELTGSRLHPFEIETTTAQYDLSFSVLDLGDVLHTMVEYDVDLFDDTTVRRLWGHLETFLEGAVEHPLRRLDDLPLLNLAQRHQLIGEWQDSAAAVDPPSSLELIFEARAAFAGDAVAVVWGDEQLSYRELDRKAELLAGRLCALGVGPECLVGLAADRSLDLLVGLMGILKSGGAYLALDLSYPRERLAWMLEDSQTRWLVTCGGLAAELPPHTAHVIGVESGSQVTAEAAPRPELASDRLAYVLYTSGSTGRPKGIPIVHRAVVSFLSAMNERLGFSAEGTLLAVTTLAFDISVLELLLPLTAGGRIALADRETATDGLRLAAEIDRLRATTLQATPATWQLLVQAGWKGRRGLQILCGGEALSGVLGNELARRGRVVWNLYGPTETTIWATMERVEAAAGPIPLGRPIANTQVYIVDQRLEPQPIGVAGEIHIGGRGVSRGYWRRPALAAERFRPDPLGGEPGGRLYGTGDLGRFGRDGRAEFLGRLDHQVKLRGFRIELGEIETCLLEHPQVSAVVVGLRGERLVAWVISTAEPENLRAHLRASLPDYMLPTAWVTLEALPLLPNGKIDRKSLPEPAGERLARPAWEAPRTLVETQLAAIWAEVLGIEKVGRHDSFFELGGHSLLAVQLVSRMVRDLGLELELRALFEAPRLIDLAARVERERASGLLREVPPIVAVPRDGALPLSFAQQRLWFIDQLEPDSSIYNIPAALRFESELEIPVLAAVFTELVRRHESLRTRFSSLEGKPVQRIAPHVPVPLPVVDLRRLAEGRGADEMRRLMGEEASRPFDLSWGPLLRVGLLRLGAAEWVLLVTMHHIASDGWSMEILTQEVSTLYQAFAAGRPSPLAELPIQYADYAAWQRGWLAGEVLAAEIDYWRQQLAGVPPVLELPTDRPRPALMSYRGASRSLWLPEDFARSLTALCRKEGLTHFMMFLAAFQVLLNRWSGQPDVCVGTPIAGRNRLEIEGLIGFFVNTLILRTRFDSDPEAVSLLGRVRETTLEAHAHQDLPFERLVEELQPERDLSRSPLFQVMFTFQNAAAAATMLSDLNIRRVGSPAKTIPFDLSCIAVEEADGIQIFLGYAIDLFDATTTERMLRQLRMILVGMVEAPRRRLSSLSMVSAAERVQLLMELGRGQPTAPSRPSSWLRLFAAQTEGRPASIAIVSKNGCLSYRQLDHVSDLWAERLICWGVGAEKVVGVSMERSIEAIVALLAVWKAGGVYLPLDPSLPAERLAFMASDAGAAWVLTDGGLSAKVAWGNLRVEAPGSEWSRVPALTGQERDGARSRLPERQAADLAYVIYTSGSTGAPKGVGVEHQAIFYHAIEMQKVYGLGAEDRVLQFASLGFDASLEQILTPLSAGSSLVLRRAEAETEEELWDGLIEAGLTVVNLPPAVWAGLAHETKDRRAPLASGRLRLMIVGGDVMPPAPLALWQRMKGVRLLNAYGPTEAVVTTTIHRLPSNDIAVPFRVPIGRPVGERFLYLQDRHGQLVPRGVIGELMVGGARLARGYLRRPGLTAREFVPDPWSELSGGRLYKTGDLARYLANGDLELIGRHDHQVKLRGYRIELGEIEATLRKQPGVLDAIARIHEDASTGSRLVAHVIPETAAILDLSGLRASLKRTLPDYMVPSTFVVLKALPLTANGKVDRTALVAPELKSQAASTAPCTMTEEILCGIWAESLGRESIGTEEDFFALGGHSLLAMQVVSRIRGSFQVELPVRALFEAPTVAGLAAIIERQRRANQDAELPPLERASRERSLPLSFAQQRLWFIDQLSPSSSAYNVPVTLRLAGGLGVAALAAAFTELVRRHEPLRASFPVSEDGQPIQHIALPGPMALPVVDLEKLELTRRQTEALRLAATEAGRPFDLARGPVLRIGLVRLDALDHVLLLTMHHIASDGWSMGILTREMSVLYEAFSAGRPSPLPELETQYADYAAWQRGWLTGAVLANELDFWRRHLGSEPPVLELPYDRPLPARPTGNGAQRVFPLPLGLSQAVLAFSRAESATPFMTLLAVFAILLGRRAKQDAFVVGMTVAGRTRLDLEGMIGFFINVLPLRIDLEGAPSFHQLLGRVRDLTLAALSHQDLPLEKLVEELRPERQADSSPLFQVKFGVQNAPHVEARVAGLEIQPFLLDHETVRFHLTVWVLQTEDELAFQWTFNTDLFDEATIVLLHRQFETLLASALADPCAEIDELELWGESEREERSRSRQAREESRYQRLKLSKPKGLRVVQPHE